MMMNSLKIIFAEIVIISFDKLFIILNKITKRKYCAKEHYYKMIFFRKVFKDYYVTIMYDNPLSLHKQLKSKINLVDNCSQHYLNAKGQYEIEWISLIHKVLPYHDCFIDIGANLGVFSVTIAQANPSKKIIAVEPLKKNYELLKENIRINDLSNCEYKKKVVSNHKGTLKFYVNPIHDGGGSLIEDDFYRTGNVALDVKEYQEKHKEFEYYQEVESIAIDDFVTSSSVIKIDVEGAELDVLKSGLNSLKKGLCDVVIVEVLMEKTFNDVVKLMNGLNYECYKLGRAVLLTGTEEMDWFVFNIICVRKGCNKYQEIVDLINSNVKN